MISADKGASGPGPRVPHRRRPQVLARRRDGAAAEAPGVRLDSAGHQAGAGEGTNQEGVSLILQGV